MLPWRAGPFAELALVGGAGLEQGGQAREQGGEAGQALDVPGVDQPRLEPGSLQQVERRLPVLRRPPSPPGSPPGKPAGQPAPAGTGSCGIGLHLLHPYPGTALIGDPHAAHQLGLARSTAAISSMIPQEPWALLEISNPRARSNNARPVTGSQRPA